MSTGDVGQQARLEGWAAAVDAARTRCPHLHPAEVTLAERWLGVSPDAIRGPVSGLIVGQMPGASTSAGLPMFPYPAGSAGARLAAISRIPLGDYLGRLMRTNLIREYSPIWSTHAARNRVDELLATLAGPDATGLRVLLLGERVHSAFRHGLFGAGLQMYEPLHALGVHLVAIPHPSGRSRVMNDPGHRRQTRRALRWAADWRENDEDGEAT